MDELEALILEAFNQTVSDYNQFVDEIIESEEEFADIGLAGRDIIDTGRLKESKQVEQDGYNATFEWNPVNPKNGFPYAPAVWAGFHPWGNTNRYIPGRHWGERAAAKLGGKGVTNHFVNKLQEMGIKATVLVNGDEELDT